MHLAEDKDQWWALLNMVRNLGTPQKAGNFLTSGVTVSFSIRTALHGVSYNLQWDMFRCIQLMSLCNKV
jgi:hypothetical protein